MSIQQNFPAISPSLNLNFARSKTLDPRITFTRTSSATRVNGQGLVEVVPANSARFDHSYDPVSGTVRSLGLLVEESRVNNTLQSSRLDANWIINVSGGSGTFIDGEKVTSSVLAVDATYDALLSTSSTFTLRNTVSGQPYGLLTGVTSGATRNITSQTNTGGAGNVSAFLTTETSAPDSSNNAVLCNPTTAGSQLRFITRNHTTSTAGTYTYSIFFKNKNISNNFVAIYLGNETALSNVVANFNVSTKTFGNTGQNGGWTGSVGYQDYPNGWIRIWVTATTTASSHTILTGSLWIGGYQGTLETIGSLYAWGSQLESGSFPTSYIPTTISTATRTADNASMRGENFSSWYNQSEGTLFAAGFSSNTGSNRFVADITDSGVNEEIGLYWNTVFNSLVNDNGVGQANSFGGTIIVNNRMLHSFGYKLNDFQGYGNATALASITSGTLPTPDRLTIGSRTNLSFWLNGTISQLTYYPKRLPNAFLQNLTK